MSDAIDDLVATIHALHDYVVQIHGELADAKGRLERMNRDGPVTDVDASNHRIRVQIGEDADGTPMKTGWIPYSQWAGDQNIHIVPSVGQQMHVISPDGDIEQARAYPLTWSNQNKAPSTDAKTVVSTLGGVTTTSSGGTQTIKGNLIVQGSVTIKGDVATTGKLKNNGHDVGSTHQHSGVQPGAGDTGTPL